MKKVQYYLIPLTLLLACERDEPITINVEDLIISIDENPLPGQILETVPGTTNSGQLFFTITSENPIGAFEVEATSGLLSVRDETLFDFETNPTLTAEVSVSQGTESEIANITVNLNDIDEQIDTSEGTIWTGSAVTFTKADKADHLLEQNQDKITDKVWLTRALTNGIFNIKSEGVYEMNASPFDTEWAFGTTSAIVSLNFKSWQEAVNNSPPNMINLDMVLHLVTDDIYVDIKFLSWSCCGDGGFSYVRSSE